MLSRTIAACLILVVMGASPALAETVYVDDDAPVGGDGTSWASAYRYLQDALATAESGDEIRVAQGTYKPDQDEAGNVTPGERAETFQLASGVGVYGGYAGLGAPDPPDERKVGVYQTILSGDLNGDDGPLLLEQCTACCSGMDMPLEPGCESFDLDSDGDVDNDDVLAFLVANKYSENSYHVITASYTNATAVLNGVTVSGGYADGGGSWLSFDGGGVYNEVGSPTLVDCTFVGNAATSGGGMRNNYATPVLTDCKFIGNAAIMNAGGGIRNSYNSNVTLTNCTFSNNVAAREGGGLGDYSASRSTLDYCSFTANMTLGWRHDDGRPFRSYGGAMTSQGNSSAILRNCTFTDNKAAPWAYPLPAGQASGHGGGLANYETNATLSNCTFSGNMAQTGGALWNLRSSPRVEDCIFIENVAEVHGGGVRTDNSTSPTFAGCSFIRNASMQGGGMRDRRSGTTLTDCIFTGNTSSGSGGGLEIQSSSISLTNCIFTGNIANGWGGGGGLRVLEEYPNTPSTPTLTNCVFEGNAAPRGGGMRTWDVPILSVDFCTFATNTATARGGGVFNRNSSVTMTNCNLHDNTAGLQGGGVYNSDNSTLLMTACVLRGNAAAQGGALANYMSSPSLINCTLNLNTAEAEGGAVFETSSSSILTNCTLVANVATSGTALACDSLDPDQPSLLQVTNCILWDGGNEVWNNDVSTIMITYSDICGCYPGTGNIDADPLFVDADNDDYHLQQGSPCVDRGYNAAPYLPLSDFEGDLRQQNENVDMGVDETLYGRSGSPYVCDNRPPVAICKDVTTMADDTCYANVSPWDIDDGSYDPDGDPISLTLDPPGPYSAGETVVTLTVADDRGGSGSCTATVTVEDRTPPVLVGVPADVTVECDAVPTPPEVTATDNCDPAPVVTLHETRADGSCANGYTLTRTWTGTDASNNSVSKSQTITVHDTTPPSILAPGLTGEPLLVPVDSPVTFKAYFADNCSETFDATWDFGDGYASGPEPVTDAAAGYTTTSYVYAAAGIYTVTLALADACGNTATDRILVVVYGPAVGFTTGGGWFIPDADSFVDGAPVTDTTSKANFGFVVKYKKGADNPDGSLEFIYKAGDINLHSLDMEWLVVTSTSKVRFKGLATINGEGEYTFKVTAEDNGEPGTNDTFQIEIWLGPDVDTENGPPTPKHKAKGVLGGGNIKIHN